jgi:hypothetical protein
MAAGVSDDGQLISIVSWHILVRDIETRSRVFYSWPRTGG